MLAKLLYLLLVELKRIRASLEKGGGIGLSREDAASEADRELEP